MVSHCHDLVEVVMEELQSPYVPVPEGLALPLFDDGLLQKIDGKSHNVLLKPHLHHIQTVSTAQSGIPKVHLVNQALHFCSIIHS